MVRIIVSGGRDFNDVDVVFCCLDEVQSELGKITELAHGGATGADKLAGMYAQTHKIPFTVFKAEWHIHGRAAGMIRNNQMLHNFNPDLVVFFPGGKGTSGMKNSVLASRINFWQFDKNGNTKEKTKN
jgi:hypothetical protein